MNQPSSVARCSCGVACGSCSVHICHVLATWLGSRTVVPRWRRCILDPRMVRSGVIGHLILDHLEPECVRASDQLLQIRHRSKVLFDTVEIHGSVAVVVGDGLVVVGLFLIQMVDVVVPRVQPDGGDAEVLQVRQLRGDTLEVSTVVVAGFRPVIKATRDRLVRCWTNRRPRIGPASPGRSHRPCQGPGSGPRDRAVAGW